MVYRKRDPTNLWLIHDSNGYSLVASTGTPRTNGGGAVDEYILTALSDHDAQLLKETGVVLPRRGNAVQVTIAHGVPRAMEHAG